MRLHGDRSTNRYVVFQVLPHTLGIPNPTWRVLAKCHEVRNAAEYEGAIEIDARLVADLIEAARSVHAALRSRLASQGG
jgi:hypothetical protein